MRTQLTQTIAAAALILGLLSGAHAADSDKARIEAVLEGYERVLNASDFDVERHRVLIDHRSLYFHM